MRDQEGYPFSFTEHGELMHYCERRLGRPLTKDDIPSFNAFYRAYVRRKYGGGAALPATKPETEE